MALEAGSRLGPYEIVSPLEAGGMSEVYRARDEKLGREVELEVLPEAFSSDMVLVEGPLLGATEDGSPEGTTP